MKVVRPSDNPITGGYTSTHRAYDFAGLNLPDEVRAGMNGIVIERVDAYNSNWINTGTLTTKDYGNYIKIRHDDGSYELHAHLRQGSSFNTGTRVTAGQVVARIGNTGNSTGPHLHSEFRTPANVNTPVEFITNSPSPMDRRPYWFDRMNSVIWNKPHEQVTDAEVEKFVAEYPSQLSRSGLFDRICQFLFGTNVNSNIISYEQCIAKIKAIGGDIEAFRLKVIEAVKKV